MLKSALHPYFIAAYESVRNFLLWYGLSLAAIYLLGLNHCFNLSANVDESPRYQGLIHIQSDATAKKLQSARRRIMSEAEGAEKREFHRRFSLP